MIFWLLLSLTVCKAEEATPAPTAGSGDGSGDAQPAPQKPATQSQTSIGRLRDFPFEKFPSTLQDFDFTKTIGGDREHLISGKEMSVTLCVKHLRHFLDSFLDISHLESLFDTLNPSPLREGQLVIDQKMVLLAEDRQGTMTTMLSCGHRGMKE